jgi:hypothetical protein
VTTTNGLHLGAGRSSAQGSDSTVSQGPPALAYLEWALVLLFLLWMAAHLCIGWFNRLVARHATLVG